LVAFSQVKPNTIKMRTLPVFPSRVEGGTAISVTRTNGVTHLDLDFTDLERDDLLTPEELDALFVAAWDGVADTFRLYLGSSLKGEQGDQGIPGPPSPADYVSRAQAIVTSISAPVMYVRTAGYYAYGDGGQALYKRAGATSPGGFQSADGTWWQIVISDFANILQFGAVAEDNTKYVVNQTAFTDAFAAKANVLVPPGNFYTQSITVPVTARRLQLEGNLIAAGIYTGAVGVIEVQNNATGFKIEGLGSIAITSASYPTTANVRFGSSSFCTLRGLALSGGQYGVFVFGCTNVKIEYNRITAYTLIAIEGAGTNTGVHARFNNISGGVAASTHAITFGDTHVGTVYEGNVVSRARFWSYSMQGAASDFKVINNISNFSRREAIVAVGTNGIISGNICKFDNTHIDLGSSFANLTGSIITNNSFQNPQGPAIYLGAGCASNQITNIYAISPARRLIGNAVDNGSGLIRLTVDTTGLETNDFAVAVNNVGGVPNANGAWAVTVIDATHLDLQGSTFAGAFTAGGYVGDPAWCIVAIYGLASGNTISNLTLINFNNSAEFYVKEFDSPSGGGNRIFGCVGDLPNDRPVWVASVTSLVEDAIGTTVAKLPVTARNGSRILTTDGLPGSVPLTGGGSGTWAFRLNNIWRASP
jgi:hypothetical protein